MSLAFEVAEYPRYLPEDHYRLFNDTWAEYFAAGAQAKIPQETFRNLYENNPAGPAALAVARDGDVWAGSVSAIPFRAMAYDSNAFIVWQISDIMVSPEYQHRGIFSRLLGMLTDYLAGKPDLVICVFPNRRSRPGCLKCGYQAARILPTRFYPPGPAAAIYRLDPRQKVYRKFNRPVARYRKIDHKEAAELTAGRDTVLPRLVRDGEYLKWRYFQPPGEERFHLLAIEPVASGKTLVVSATCHRYGRGKFTVFLELLPQTGEDKPRWLSGILTALGRANGCGMLYANEKIETGPLSPTWRIPLPHRFNPRPIELLIYPQPGNSELERAFLDIRFNTADWLGFL